MKPVQSSQGGRDEAAAIAAPKTQVTEREAALQEQPFFLKDAPIAQIHFPSPNYPPDAWEESQEGVTTVVICIDASDNISDVKVEQSSGFPILDNAAIDAVRKATFKAAVKGGRPAYSCAKQAMRWELKTVRGSDYNEAVAALRQLQRGIDYYNGSGPRRTKDPSKALAYFRLASEKGNADAQFILGTMHRNGEGFQKSDVEAARLYRLSAMQGHRNAQKALGFMSANGEGVQKDLLESFKWFSLAANQGDSESKAKRSIVEKQLSAEQLGSAKQLVAEAERQISASTIRRTQMLTSKQ